MSEGPPRVLVVDDAGLIRLYYRGALEAAGFSVDEALNGLEAMEKVLGEHFACLIVDVNMPKMDGLSFLRGLRRLPLPASSMPVLVTSTEAAPHDLAAARAAGANYYLVKPIAQAELARHVKVLTGGLL
jgi:two-component system chemotaxis response regulator CheY